MSATKDASAALPLGVAGGPYPPPPYADAPSPCGMGSACLWRPDGWSSAPPLGAVREPYGRPPYGDEPDTCRGGGPCPWGPDNWCCSAGWPCNGPDKCWWSAGWPGCVDGIGPDRWCCSLCWGISGTEGGTTAMCRWMVGGTIPG